MESIAIQQLSINNLESAIKYIKKVEVVNLWNSTDIVWELNSDVNILSGINGSGKTTLLDCVCELITLGDVPKRVKGYVKEIKITFNNDQYVFHEYLNSNIKNIEEKAAENEAYEILLTELKERQGAEYDNIKRVEASLVSFNSLKMTVEELNNLIEINAISTFDTPFVNSESIAKVSDAFIVSELDWDIYMLQKKYLDYQLNVGKRAIEFLSNKNNLNIDSVDFPFFKSKFFDIIDNLFEKTGKKIDRSKNELAFVKADKNLSAYQLSSGEKQMILILMTVLVQDNKPSILFMDEPEISLHFDWQRKLIENIRLINPNVQVIIATHSPAVVMEGWHDKVYEISDLSVRN